MPPPNSFPLTLSCPGAFIVVLPHIFYMVFLRNALCGVSRLRRDAIRTCLENVRSSL
jgi:hypothetical protein